MSWTAFFNGILLIAALTTDSFVVSFSYGAGNVRMSMKMILIMNLVMSFLLAGGIWTGRIMENLFPKTIAAVAGAFVLLGMGGYRLLNFFYPGKAQENQESWIIFRGFFWPLSFLWMVLLQESAQDWYRLKKNYSFPELLLEGFL